MTLAGEDKKRIGLFLGVDTEAGGMFQYAQSLLEALRDVAADGHHVEVATVGSAWDQTLVSYPFGVSQLRDGPLGLRMAQAFMVARVPAGLIRWLTPKLNPIAKQLRQLSCDVWIFPAQDAIAFQVPENVIATVHDLMHRYEPRFPEAAGWLRGKVRDYRFQSLARYAKGILVDSELGRTHVVQSYGADPRKIYPLPYIPPRHLQVRHDAGDHYALPAKYIFYPAQFWEHKNHMALLGAAARLRDRIPDLHFVFAGSKRRKFEEIRGRAEVLGMADRVTFLGYVPDADIAGLYRRARALVMPTFFGPTNIPPLEALACDCPVAVSGIYAMRDQLGDAALYFDPRSESDIASAIERLWNDEALCEALRVRGRARLAAWGQTQFGARLRSILADVWAR